MADRSEGSVALVSEREQPAPKLAVSHLVKTRRSTSGETVTAVDDVTFEVHQGEFVCLLGPSGCGKTTILNILAGLDQPTSGSALLDGKPIPGPGPDRAVLFQEPALFPWLSVVANVEFALKHVGVAPDERRTRAMSWLENVHLTGNANAQPHELSAGMRQRAVLARALACDPDVLLGDEPFGALDAQARELLQNEVQRVWVESEGRKTFVFVTHNVREAALLADRVLVMTAAPGRLLEEVRIHAPASAQPGRRVGRPGRLGDPRGPDDRGQQGGVVVRRLAKELGPPLVGVAGLLVVWAIVAAFVSPTIVPSPAEVWSAFTRGVSDGTIPEAAAKTLLRLAFSFVVSIVIGTALGFGLALNEFARRSIRPLVVALQITPFIAWLPLAVVWFGLTERAVVFVTIVGAFPSVTLATIASFGQVPPLLKRAGRTLGADGWQLYREVIFPAALPGYVAGLDQAWGFAWKALMAGELITAGLRATGLGQLAAALPGRRARC